MSKIKEPKRSGTKGAPLPEADTSNNLSKRDVGGLVGLNFKVSPEFRREFKGYANDNDMKMLELLQNAYEFYKEHHS